MAELHRSASFSRCKRYRYSLRRRWAEGSGTCAFIGLNPSIADTQADDPTIRRCIGFAQDWGYEELLVVNLFAFRTPLPAELKRAIDPVGPRNRGAVRAACKCASVVIAAWGVHGSFHNQAHKMRDIWHDYELYCFGRTKNGHPLHPLYQRREAELVLFD